MDILLGLLKAASASLSGILGVAALYSDYRGPDGKLTGAGRGVFAGILIAAVVGVITSFVETNKSQADSKEQATRTETLLREVSRAVQPITQFNVHTAFEIPAGHATVDSYVKRFRESIEKRTDLKFPYDQRLPEFRGLSFMNDENDTLELVRVEYGSDLWPIPEKEPDMSLLAATATPSVYLMRKPIKPETFQVEMSNADFEVPFVSKATRNLAWHVKRKQLVAGSDFTSSKDLWKTNGRITSVVDLRGAQLILLFSGSLNMPPPKGMADVRTPEREAINKSLIIRAASLDLGEGRTLYLPAKDFRQSKYHGGDPIFYYTFPTDEKEFLKLYDYQRDYY
ncbi:hypothetical protein JQ574_34170 [Bradyrhizobium sp. AUGA SZCCT0158]|uniref:hypothetical protein n=1 Tax=Bradyrhizobium sp. AUGA SZCCT0158 TaxID=2807661 RepID=UPI001BA5284A|nr:hypothetical protein [Bradyrhizobium sp. AUGA SZCCT0158]MBR1201050.1 hypothetical protein [Bradyrhizobium sp. AUGA SZCCT0158]